MFVLVVENNGLVSRIVLVEQENLWLDKINMKKVIIEFTDIDADNTIVLSEKDCIDKVQKIIMGAEPYPLMDPCRPYVGTMVNITCGDTTKICSVWNQHNVDYDKWWTSVKEDYMKLYNERRRNK